MNIDVDTNCLAHAVLLSMSIIEKGDLYRAILAGFDRYLKTVIKDQLIEIEKSCQVDTKQGVPIYNKSHLHENYLREKNYHLCVYTENDSTQDKVLLYDSCRKNGKIVELSDKKLVLLHKNNHFDIITNFGLFLYGRKVAYCVKCMMSIQDQLNHVCFLYNRCVKCLHIHDSQERYDYDSKCPLCDLFFHSKQCLYNHYLQINKVGKFEQALSACQIYFYCKKCCLICRRFHYVNSIGKMKFHNCNQLYCKLCKCNRKRIHDCFISAEKRKAPFYTKNPDLNYHIYVFDFETEARPDNMGIFMPYYCTVYKFCNTC